MKYKPKEPYYFLLLALITPLAICMHQTEFSSHVDLVVSNKNCAGRDELWGQIYGHIQDLICLPNSAKVLTLRQQFYLYSVEFL